MKATVLDHQGLPSVLRLVQNYPKPVLTANHVLLRVMAIGEFPRSRLEPVSNRMDAAVAQSDLMTRRGFTAGPKIEPPKIIGSECVGIVEAVSPELERHDSPDATDEAQPRVWKYKPGDVVIALMGGMGRFFDGCYAGKYPSLVSFFQFLVMPPNVASPCRESSKRF